MSSTNTPPPASPEEIEALICLTYTDERLDPYEPEEEMEARLERFCGLGGAPTIFQVSQLPVIEDYYVWDSERADLIEEYVSPERLDALEEGATPTDEEREWFDAAALQYAEEDESAFYRCKSALVYRLAASHESGEKRVIYFCWIGHIGGQYSETSHCVGPLRNAAEVEKALEVVTAVPCDYFLEKDCTELADFLDRLKLDREGHPWA